MHSLQRQLVNLDILISDIEALNSQAYASAQHAHLLNDVQHVLRQIDESAKHETVTSFQRMVLQSGLEKIFADKRMPAIYLRLLDYVLQYWAAQQKADTILQGEFNDNADKRLELLQVKCVKAKTQFKTVAQAMGRIDYEIFLRSFGLTHEDWGWQ